MPREQEQVTGSVEVEFIGTVRLDAPIRASERELAQLVQNEIGYAGVNVVLVRGRAVLHDATQ